MAVLNLASVKETNFCNQPEPKIHKVFIGTRSLMSLIMSEIRLATWELFSLELLKIAVLNLVSVIETWLSINLDQSCKSIYRHKISNKLYNERNPSSNMRVISQSIWTKVAQSIIGTRSGISPIKREISRVTPLLALSLLALKDWKWLFYTLLSK